MYIVKRKFKSDKDWYVTKDLTVLKKWERCEINANQAAKMMAENNGWESLPVSEFIDIANSLGYFREARKEGDVSELFK